MTKGHETTTGKSVLEEVLRGGEKHETACGVEWWSD